MSSRLQNKVAVVTGAAKGIGAAIAKALAAEGAAVAVNYAADKAGADRVVAEIQAKGGRALAIQADVARPAEVKRLFVQTVEAFGAPSILVNNAGVFRFFPIEELDAEEYRRQFDTNVLGTLNASKEAVRTFDDRGGSIINLSSVVSESPAPFGSVYSATKAAVDAITGSLAKELGSRGIRVNAIAPGPVETEGFASAGLADGDFVKSRIALTPLGRIGQPDDIAEVAVFLASDAARWVTGERILASGGLV
jgi:3-oxoacyl-[acyl-carrier protein] reductase